MQLLLHAPMQVNVSPTPSCLDTPKCELLVEVVCIGYDERYGADDKSGENERGRL